MTPLDYRKGEKESKKPRNFQLDLDAGRNIRALIWFSVVAVTVVVLLFVASATLSG
jgi:hypothetical protein